jgi:hypothetical protein
MGLSFAPRKAARLSVCNPISSLSRFSRCFGLTPGLEQSGEKLRGKGVAKEGHRE